MKLTTLLCMLTVIFTSCAGFFSKDYRNPASSHSEFALPMYKFKVIKKHVGYDLLINDKKWDVYPGNVNVAMKINYLSNKLKPNEEFFCEGQGFISNSINVRGKSIFHLYALNNCDVNSGENSDLISIDRVTPGNIIQYKEKEIKVAVSFNEKSVKSINHPTVFSPFIYFFAKEMGIREIFEDELVDAMNKLKNTKGITLTIEEISPSLDNNKREFYYNLGRKLNERGVFFEFIQALAEINGEAYSIMTLVNELGKEDSKLFFLNDLEYSHEINRGSFQQLGIYNKVIPTFIRNKLTVESLVWAGRLAEVSGIDQINKGGTQINQALRLAFESTKLGRGKTLKLLYALYFELDQPRYIEEIIKSISHKR